MKSQAKTIGSGKYITFPTIEFFKALPRLNAADDVITLATNGQIQFSSILIADPSGKTPAESTTTSNDANLIEVSTGLLIPFALTEGSSINVFINKTTTNAVPPTLKVNALAATLIKENDVLIAAGALQAGFTYKLTFTNGAFQLTTATSIAAELVEGHAPGLFKIDGSIDCSANPNYSAAIAGTAISVSVAGKIGGAAGRVVEAGDFLFCIADSTAGTQAAVGANWQVMQNNLDVVQFNADVAATAVNAAAALISQGAAAASAAAALISEGNSLGSSTASGVSAAAALISQGAAAASAAAALVSEGLALGSSTASGVSAAAALISQGAAAASAAIFEATQDAVDAAGAPVALDMTKRNFSITTTGGWLGTFTMGPGIAGQKATLSLQTKGGAVSAVITPIAMGKYLNGVVTTITLSEEGATVELVYLKNKWNVIGAAQAAVVTVV